MIINRIDGRRILVCCIILFFHVFCFFLNACSIFSPAITLVPTLALSLGRAESSYEITKRRIKIGRNVNRTRKIIYQNEPNSIEICMFNVLGLRFKIQI